MSWDNYFLNMCNTVAQNSKCLSRKIGAIIVRDKSVVSTGYNGPPRNVQPCNLRWNTDLREYWDRDNESYPPSDTCPRYHLGFKSGEGLHICIAGHAERNALINAARNGIATRGAIMYMNCAMPCIPCLIEIINAGIKEIVITSPTIYDKTPETTRMLLRQSFLKWRTFKCLQTQPEK